MLRIKFGEREWQFDETAALTMGEVVVLREMGVAPAQFGQLLSRIGTRTGRDLSGPERIELAESCAQLAFLAAVREDHSLRWRDFVWTIPLDALRMFDVVANEPAEKAAVATSPVSSVGAALAEATSAKPRPKAPRKTRAKST